MAPPWRRFVALRPGGAAQSHASSLLVVGEEVLVAWFAGAREGASDTRIYLARGDRNGEFGPPRVIAEAPVPHWNPVLASGPDGRVWLFFRRGDRIDTWRTWVCRSVDAGRTWDDPAELVPGDRSGGRGPVRQAPLRYGDAWVAPGSVEVWTPTPRWDCFVDLSTDAGASWTRVPLALDHEALRGPGCIQPSLAIGSRGQLIALARSSGGAAYRSETRDPRAWPELRPTALPNNNSGLALVGLPDGRLACVHNPAAEDWGSRCPLVVSTSADDGLTWTPAAAIDDGSPFSDAPGSSPTPAVGGPARASATGVVTDGTGEYSYPSAALWGEELWVTYSWQRRGIALARLPLASLTS